MLFESTIIGQENAQTYADDDIFAKTVVHVQY